MSGDNNGEGKYKGEWGSDENKGEWPSGEQDYQWLIPEFERRRVERMVRQVLRVKSGIYIDGIVDIVGSFVGARLRGRPTTSWFLGGTGWRRNPNLPDSDE